MRTLDDVLAGLPAPAVTRLEPPPYDPPADVRSGLNRRAVGLAVESMKRHMTDEGWQLFAGLEAAGYTLAGHNLVTRGVDGERWAQHKANLTDVRDILAFVRPATVVVQDKREWDPGPRDFREPAARFGYVAALAGRADMFKMTVLKDAQARPPYHRESAAEMGVHGWIIYYHPRIVARLAPYVRPEHLVRTYHTLDADLLGPYSAAGRAGALLSGATGGAYPLRTRLFAERARLPHTTVLPFPGYHRGGSATPAYLKTLEGYRVAVCTASRFGYLLRKIIEATAAGCRVVTDLPVDEVVPAIDANLIRVRAEAPTQEVAWAVQRGLDEYKADVQAGYAAAARTWYDYRTAGLRLAWDIEALRLRYGGVGWASADVGRLAHV